MKSREQEVYTVLVRRIVRGFYADRETLPSERDFADEFETSRTVIREVMKRLISDGYIEMLSPGKRRVAPGQPAAVFDPNSRMVAMIGACYTGQGKEEERLLVSWRRLRGIFKRLDLLGFSTFNLPLSWPPEMILEYLASYKVRGLIYVNEGCHLPRGTEEFLYQTLAGRLPIATFGDTEPLACSAVPGIERCLADHRQGPRLLLRHLASRGCRRALWYYPYRNRPSLVWHRERQCGYEEAAREFNMELIAFSDVLPFSDEAGSYDIFVRGCRIIAECIAPYFKGNDGADAVVVNSDVSVPFFQRALRELGIPPGGRIPVVGYDNYYFLEKTFPWESTPPAATIDKNDRLAGEQCVDLIERRLQADEAWSEPFRDLIPPRLVLPGNQPDSAGKPIRK